MRTADGIELATDPIAAPHALRELFERLGSTSKRLRIYPGFLHEVLNEPKRAQVVKDLLAWLGEQTTRDHD